MTSCYCLTLLLLISCKTSTADDNNLESPEHSDAFLKLLNVFNGKFSDNRQVEAYKSMDDPDLEVPASVYVLSIPVEIPALAPAVTYLYEQYYLDTLRRRLICVLWEDKNGEIYMQPYNITSPPDDRTKPISLNQIKKLTPSDLTTREECKVKFQRKGTQTFLAVWPDCTTNDDGIVPNYQLTWSCNSMVAIATNPNSVEYTPVPIMLTREGPRYPFPPYLNEANGKVTC